MDFKKAMREDIDAFVEHRLEFVTSIRKIDNVNEFRRRTKVYLEEHIDKDDLAIFITVENKKIISSCMACVFQTVPLPSCPTGKKAELLNVYTKQEYRRNGYSEKLIRMLLEELKKRNVEKVLLEYTDMGFLLYKKLGFIETENQMQIRL